MKKYGEYKDSGVQWIGETPSHWKVARLKNKSSIVLGKMLMNNPPKGEESLYTLHPYLKSRNVGWLDLSLDDIEQMYFSDYEISLYKLSIGDIVINEGGDIGKVALWKGYEEDVYIQNSVHKITPSKEMSNEFLMYFLLSTSKKKYFWSIVNQVSIAHLTKEKLSNTPILIPPLSEQQSIASFLDAKTKPINDIISKREKQIELLEEMKSAIISHAVTKGLNPDAKMKDSGIEWIGEMPEHWRIAKTLLLLSMPITDGPHETPKLYDSGIPFISAEAVSGGEIDFTKMRGYISEKYYQECCKKYIPKLDDIYMIKSGATTGRIAKVKTIEIFTIWSPLAVFRVNKHVVTSDYLYYVLKSDYYQRQVELGWNYGTQQNIGMRTLEKLLIAFPEVEEQKQISSYLDTEISKFDARIAKRRRQIELLQEYKQALITDAVTGKIDVREYNKRI